MMAKSFEVLGMLIPNGGYVQTGTEYEGIEFIDCEPITKKQYTDGFAQFDAWKAEQETTKATEKAALLAKLGITVDEAALLLS
jgi:Na+-transporting NADH:ubiquinone oxidoreductase subunit NqrF